MLVGITCVLLLLLSKISFVQSMGFLVDPKPRQITGKYLDILRKAAPELHLEDAEAASKVPVNTLKEFAKRSGLNIDFEHCGGAPLDVNALRICKPGDHLRIVWRIIHTIHSECRIMLICPSRQYKEQLWAGPCINKARAFSESNFETLVQIPYSMQHSSFGECFIEWGMDTFERDRFVQCIDIIVEGEPAQDGDFTCTAPEVVTETLTATSLSSSIIATSSTEALPTDFTPTTETFKTTPTDESTPTIETTPQETIWTPTYISTPDYSWTTDWNTPSEEATPTIETTPTPSTLEITSTLTHESVSNSDISSLSLSQTSVIVGSAPSSITATTTGPTEKTTTSNSMPTTTDLPATNSISESFTHSSLFSTTTSISLPEITRTLTVYTTITATITETARIEIFLTTTVTETFSLCPYTCYISSLEMSGELLTPTTIEGQPPLLTEFPQPNMPRIGREQIGEPTSLIVPSRRQPNM